MKGLFILHLPKPIHGASIVGKNIKNFVGTTSSDSYFINLSLSNNLKSIGNFSVNKLFNYLRILIEIIFYLFTKKIDFVYLTPSANLAAFIKDSIIIIICKLFKKKIYLHFHNKGFNSIKNKLVIKYFNIILNNTNIVLLSKILIDDFKIFNKSKFIFHICSNGVSITNNNKTNSFLKPKLFFLSNLIDSKGYLDVVDICNELYKKKIDFECNIVGDGTDNNINKLLNKINHYKLENKVNYLGKKYGKSKLDLLSSHNIFLFPSKYPKECFPLSILEAMAFGLVCITSKEGAISEIIDDDIGYSFNKNFVKNFTKTIIFLNKNRTIWKIKSDKTINKFNKNYTIDRFEKKLKKILN